jgi:hypothetical protein
VFNAPSRPFFLPSSNTLSIRKAVAPMYFT